MPEPIVPQRRNPIFIFLLVLWGFYLVLGLPGLGQRQEPVPYSEFLQAVSEGRVEKVAVGQTRIEGKFRAGPPGHARDFSTVRIEDPALLPMLQKSGVRFTGVEEGGGFWSFFSGILPILLLILFWSFVLRQGMGGRKGGVLSLGKSRAKIYVETDLKTRFDDVAGVDEAKEELREVVNFLREPARYSTLGGRMPKGILLVGPPGTGKTMLARAAAGEAGVAFFSINGSEFVEMFVGLGAARVRDLFEQARNRAPCIVFIDELDALGKARGMAAFGGGSNDEKEQTLNQLLAELDGFDPSRGVVLIGATNRPEILDPALLRAGRFDRSLLVDRPDRKGRLQILQVHAKKIKMSAAVDLEALAGMTAGFSGAELANLVNEAALIGTRRGATEVELADFTAAIERIVAGLEKKSRILSPREKRRVSYHEMGHATTGLALGEQEVVHKVSIIPRGIGALGYTMSRPTEDRYLMERAELENKIVVLLGGRAAEIEFFSDISTGAGDDLDKATEIARAMITRYGMSGQLGLGTLERDAAPMLGGRMPVKSFEYSEQTAQEIDREIRRILDQSLGRARELVRRHRAFVEEAAQLLLTRESLDEATIKQLWSRHQAPLLAVR